MKVYAKDSFDRFGDDLTEEILQYLTFECVSKQWQRCVYRKQFVIDIQDIYESKTNNSLELVLKRRTDANGQQIQFIDQKLLKYILEKCPNIKKVIIKVLFSVDIQVMNIFGEYCRHIKALDCSLESYQLMRFASIYGNKIEELKLNDNSSNFRLFLRMCRNVKNISVIQDWIIFNDDNQFLPKLEAILFAFEINSENLIRLNTLSIKYNNTMKVLKVRLLVLTAEELKICIEFIARFENLKKLVLTIRSENIGKKQPIDRNIALIGEKFIIFSFAY